MLDEYVPRIRKCTELLTEDQSWISPGTFNNSVANLLMHLAGNVRQWIICGVGDAGDERNRPFEFSGNRDSFPRAKMVRLGHSANIESPGFASRGGPRLTTPPFLE